MCLHTYYGSSKGKGRILTETQLAADEVFEIKQGAVIAAHVHPAFVPCNVLQFLLLYVVANS